MEKKLAEKKIAALSAAKSLHAPNKGRVCRPQPKTRVGPEGTHGHMGRSRADTLPRSDGKTTPTSGSSTPTGSKPRMQRRPSMHSSDRSSTKEKRSPLKLENTYKLEPDSRFNDIETKTVIEDVLKQHLDMLEYDSACMGEKASTLSEIIKEKLKSQGYKRHKLVVTVFIAQHSDTSVRVTSRCLWDTLFDTSVTATYSSPTLHATAAVFAVYYE